MLRSMEKVFLIQISKEWIECFMKKKTKYKLEYESRKNCILRTFNIFYQNVYSVFNFTLYSDFQVIIQITSILQLKTQNNRISEYL